MAYYRENNNGGWPYQSVTDENGVLVEEQKQPASEVFFMLIPFPRPDYAPDVFKVIRTEKHTDFELSAGSDFGGAFMTGVFLDWKENGVTTAYAGVLGGSRFFFTFSRDYTGSTGPVQLRFRSNEVTSDWVDVYIKAVPRVIWTASTDEPGVVIADASDSFTPTSNIVSYAWFVGESVETILDSSNSPIAGGISIVDSEAVTTEPRVRFNLEDLAESSASDPALVAMRCRIIDDTPDIGNYDPYYASRYVALSLTETIGTIQTPDGALIMARAEGSPKAVKIRRMEESETTGTELSTLEGYSRPRLTQRTNGQIILTARNDSSKQFERKTSLDGGETWQ